MMDMDTQEFTYRIKQLEITIGILSVVLAAIIVYIFWLHKQDISINEQRLASQVANMMYHDKLRDSTIRNLQKQRIVDSVHIVSISTQVDNVPSMINRINTKYNDKRNYITALSDDEQLDLLTDNLSQDTDN